MALEPTNSEPSAVAVASENGAADAAKTAPKGPSLWERIQGVGWRGWLLVAVFLGLYGQVLIHLVRQWNSDADYSHGFLVPFLSAYLIWQRRDKLAEIPRNNLRSDPLFLGMATVAGDGIPAGLPDVCHSYSSADL